MGILRRCGGAGFPDALFVADVIFAPGLADKGLSGCGGFVRNAPDVPTIALLRAIVQMKQDGEFDTLLARYR